MVTDGVIPNCHKICWLKQAGSRDKDTRMEVGGRGRKKKDKRKGVENRIHIMKR